MIANSITSKAPVSARQFGLFRIALGTYLIVHFLQLLPYAGELFGNDGIAADPSLNFVPNLLFNPLCHPQAPEWLPHAVLGMGILASIGILTGQARRIACLIAWLVWAWLFQRNNLISNPSLPYVGLMLLMGAVIPKGEDFVLGRKEKTNTFFFPAWAFWGMWFLLTAGYSFSGLIKCFSPGWIDGSALTAVLNCPLARPGMVRELFLSLPEFLMRGATWIVLGMELFSLPLMFFRRTRFLAWWFMVAMHLGIILVVDFADLSMGMLLAHAFVWDGRWLSEWRTILFGGRQLWAAGQDSGLQPAIG